jgi:hypothetical protein
VARGVAARVLVVYIYYRTYYRCYIAGMAKSVKCSSVDEALHLLFENYEDDEAEIVNIPPDQYISNEDKADADGTGTAFVQDLPGTIKVRIDNHDEDHLPQVSISKEIARLKCNLRKDRLLVKQNLFNNAHNLHILSGKIWITAVKRSLKHYPINFKIPYPFKCLKKYSQMTCLCGV